MEIFKYLCVLVYALSIFQGTYADDAFTKRGYSYTSQKYEKETLDSIQTNGVVSLKGTKVLGMVNVNGSFSAEASTIHSLQINGDVHLMNCVIENSALINGSVVAQNTQFQNELSVATQKMTLKMCSVDSLTIRKVKGFTGTQIIDLRSGTTVKGSIVVESGNGQIIISPNSKIIESQVSGAVIIRQ